MQTETTPSGLDMATDADIGERVHQLMWRARLTQTVFADTLGVSQSTLSKKLRGERPWFAAEVGAVARRLNVGVAVLYGDEPMPDPSRPNETGWAAAAASQRPAESNDGKITVR